MLNILSKILWIKKKENKFVPAKDWRSDPINQSWYGFACNRHQGNLYAAFNFNDWKTFKETIEEIKKCGACNYNPSDLKCVMMNALVNNNANDKE